MRPRAPSEWARKNGFGVRLAQARERAGLTLRQAGEHLGDKGRASYLNELENSLRTPRIANVTTLADLYDVSVDWLLGRSMDPMGHKRGPDV